MIYRLLEKMSQLCREGFNGLVDNNDVHLGPINPPSGNANLPAIALHSGQLIFHPNFTKMDSNEVTPQEVYQNLAINNNTPRGPYTFNPIPLPNSLEFSVVYNQGESNERRQLLSEGTELLIPENYETFAIAEMVDMTGASRFQLRYSLAGKVALREFEQEFYIDLYHSQFSEIENMAALASSIILTERSQLLHAFNHPDNDAYIQNNYHSSPRLNSLLLLKGSPEYGSNTKHFRLSFQVKGQVRFIHSIEEGIYYIEKVQSEGSQVAPFGEPINGELGG